MCWPSRARPTARRGASPSTCTASASPCTVSQAKFSSCKASTPPSNISLQWVTSGYLLQSVTEEKENRVVEILLSSIPALPLMAGKVLGLGAAGLTQVAIWVATALVALPLLSNQLSLTISISLVTLLLAVFFFGLGYMSYGAIYAAVGALAPGAFMTNSGAHDLSATPVNTGVDVDAGNTFTVSSLSGVAVGMVYAESSTLEWDTRKHRRRDKGKAVYGGKPCFTSVSFIGRFRQAGRSWPTPRGRMRVPFAPNRDRHAGTPRDTLSLPSCSREAEAAARSGP